MAEHLFCKQAVAGSNPIAGSMHAVGDASPAATCMKREVAGFHFGKEGFHCPMV